MPTITEKQYFSIAEEYDSAVVALYDMHPLGEALAEARKSRIPDHQITENIRVRVIKVLDRIQQIKDSIVSIKKGHQLIRRKKFGTLADRYEKFWIESDCKNKLENFIKYGKNYRNARDKYRKQVIENLSSSGMYAFEDDARQLTSDLDSKKYSNLPYLSPYTQVEIIRFLFAYLSIKNKASNRNIQLLSRSSEKRDKFLISDSFKDALHSSIHHFGMKKIEGWTKTNKSTLYKYLNGNNTWMLSQTRLDFSKFFEKRTDYYIDLSFDSSVEVFRKTDKKKVDHTLFLKKEFIKDNFDKYKKMSKSDFEELKLDDLLVELANIKLNELGFTKYKESFEQYKMEEAEKELKREIAKEGGNLQMTMLSSLGKLGMIDSLKNDSMTVAVPGYDGSDGSFVVMVDTKSFENVAGQMRKLLVRKGDLSDFATSETEIAIISFDDGSSAIGGIQSNQSDNTYGFYTGHTKEAKKGMYYVINPDRTIKHLLDEKDKAIKVKNKSVKEVFKVIHQMYV